MMLLLHQRDTELFRDYPNRGHVAQIQKSIRLTWNGQGAR
jgi:hypothetical protein